MNIPYRTIEREAYQSGLNDRLSPVELPEMPAELTARFTALGVQGLVEDRHIEADVLVTAAEARRNHLGTRIWTHLTHTAEVSMLLMSAPAGESGPVDLYRLDGLRLSLDEKGMIKFDKGEQPAIMAGWALDSSPLVGGYFMKMGRSSPQGRANR